MPTDEGARISQRRYLGMPAWYHGVLIVVAGLVVMLLFVFFQ